MVNLDFVSSCNVNGCKNVFFFEEGIRTGGVGEVFGSMIAEEKLNVNYKLIAINDEFVKQASVENQLKHYKLDSNSIYKIVNNNGESDG